MSKDPYRDQAAKLKKRIEKVPDERPVKKREPLPPRSELHKLENETPVDQHAPFIFYFNATDCI